MRYPRAGAGEKIGGMPSGVVATFSTLGEAEAAKSALDAAGIESWIADENMVAMDWMYSNAIGGVKLVVADEDAGDAEEVLANAATPEEETPPQAPEIAEPHCPRCSATEIYHLHWRRLRAISLFGWFAAVIVVPLWLVLPKWQCDRCGLRTWRPARAR